MKTFIWFFFSLFLTFQIYSQQKIGKHTAAEWRYIIDSTWGFGRTTEEKLKIFDTFWNSIDQRYAGFRNIEDKWQELKTYRDTVDLGVSRGRFQGIMDHLVKSLHDGHVYMCDNGIASTQLKPGIPLFFPAAITYPSYSWDFGKHFGAALAPLPDSTVFVYSAVSNHPLGLVPGDIILGYDGRLWKDLYKDLLEIQFPIPHFYVSAGAERAATHQWLQAAGMNWHLFNTIDIVKYATGDTVHLHTDLLSTPMPGFRVTEQMPIDGVPFPEGGQDLVSWGYINGTKIGYIYLWGWTYSSTDKDFLDAVNALMPDSNSDALIIDVRFNEGSMGGSPERGFQRLFNKDMEPFLWLTRANSADHLTMKDAGINWFAISNTDKQLYDRPIAVLCGPAAISGGDMTVQCLRNHPMVRTFGLPTNGAFGEYTTISGIPNEWNTGISEFVCYMPPDINNDLNHKSVPVDEEVWFTRDGVAKGEDDVVKRAIEWVENLIYVQSTRINKTACQSGIDTLKISVQVKNPNYHQMAIKIYIKNLIGDLIDSVALYKSDTFNKSETWTDNFLAPDSEGIYMLSISIKDINDSKVFTKENISRFTTAGPLTIDSISYLKLSTNSYFIRPFVRNQSKNTTITKGKINILCDDPWTLGVAGVNLPDIPPGTAAGSNTWGVIRYDSTFPGYFNLKFEIMSDGWVYWTDSMRVTIPAVGINDQANQLLTFKLEQNYPNPFNPTTNFQYSIASRQFVNLKIFNVLGQEIETLVNEEKPAGNYEVEFNAANLPSGVYFYRIQAGSFNQVRKMLLIK